MLIEGTILAIIIGFLRGGSLKNLENIQIKLWPFIFVGGFLQLIIRVLMTQHHAVAVSISDTFPLWHLVTYLCLIIVLAANMRATWSKLFLAGTLMNLAAIMANKGLMPVKLPYPEWILDNVHSIMTDSTRLKFLCDIFIVPPPYPLEQVFSIGDLFIVAGTFLFVQYAMLNLTSSRTWTRLESPGLEYDTKRRIS